MTVAGGPDTNTIIVDVLIHITNIWLVYQLYQRCHYIGGKYSNKEGNKYLSICLTYIERMLPNEILSATVLE